MTLQGNLAIIDLTGILSHENIAEFRVHNVFSHYFSSKVCYFAFAHNDNVILILYECRLNLISGIPSYDSVVLEFPSSSGSVSYLHWLSTILIIGFETGYLMVFSDDGSCLFESKYYDSSILSIKSFETQNDLFDIWVLYESGFFINLSAIATPTSFTIRNMAKIKLIDHETVCNFVMFQTADFTRSTSTGSGSTSNVSVYVGGANSTLSLYNFGCPQQFQHFGKLAHYVKEKVVHVFSKTVLSFFDSAKQHTSDDGATTDIKEYDHAVTSVLDITDSKRKILRMIGDIDLGVVVLADNIGRVLLFDVKVNCIIRIWKGVRDARICWVHHNVGSNSTSKLCLAIYAPRTGLMSIFAMRHGPCIRTIPLGLQCHIFCDRFVSERYE
jgi:hypothetical protein